LVYKNKLCKYCGVEFTPLTGAGKFCSKECFKKSRDEWLLRDKQNNPDKYIKREKLYHITRQNKNKEKGIIPLKDRLYNCSICKNDFIPTKVNSKCCSKECKKIYSNNYTYKQRKKNPNITKKINNNFYKRYVGYNPTKEISCCICQNKFIRKTISQVYCNNKECKLRYMADKAIDNYHLNKDEILEKRKNDLNYTIKNKLRMRISCAVKSQGTYKADKTMELIGCSVEKLKMHLEKQFIDDMNWNNYGKGGWVIDHIMPCASFDLTKEENQRECFNYNNLQPMWERDNLVKNSKVICQ